MTIISKSYEECREDFFVNLIKHATNKIRYWKRQTGYRCELADNLSQAGAEIQYCQDALAALEKQTPKEHHHTRVVNIYCKMRQSICPECLSMINTAENEYPKFCTWCGQALDWGDSDSKDENDYKYLVDARIVKRCDKTFEILSTEQQGNNDKEDKK